MTSERARRYTAMTSPLDVSLDRHRRELHVHCYRMLGSFHEAEDAVQEVLLRAWRARDTLAPGDNVRAWLYKIATNVCLDALRARSRRMPTLQSFADVPWLQPYPDRLLDEIAPPEDEPDAVVVARETIALAYVAVIQLLPPRQRAVLILRDVLEWSAQGDGRHAGDQRRRRQQRAAARPHDARGAAAAEHRGRAERRRARPAGALRRRPPAGRRRGVARAHPRGHPHHDAAAPVPCTTASSRSAR